MSFYNPLGTNCFPLKAEGKTVLNQFGVQIAVFQDESEASAVVHLANLGIPAAKQEVKNNEMKERVERRIKLRRLRQAGANTTDV